jgi:hypothetical protein
MHVENQNSAVQASTADQSWWSAQWTIATTGDGWNYIINRWQTSQRIHLENLLGYAQYANAQAGWHSAMWQLVNPITARERTSDQLSLEEESLIDIYPNPSSGKEFFVDIPVLKENETADLTMMDLQGKTAFVTKVKRNEKVTHDLTPGLYFARIRTTQWNVIRKIMIE